MPIQYAKLTEEERLEHRKKRFMTRVRKDPETGCWIWTGQKDSSKHGKKGNRRYGRFRTQTNKKIKNWRAHRWAAKHLGGMDIEDKLVCHECDVPLCVNPEHLFIGTHWENMQDMASKGRRKGICNGSSHGRAKLTERDIPVIRDLLAQGEMLKTVAERFGVAPETIGDIKHGRHWVHIP